MNKQKQEEQAIDFASKLSDMTIGSNGPNFDLLIGDTKSQLDNKAADIREFMEKNTGTGLSDEEQTKLFKTVIEKWNDLRDLVKNGTCVIDLTGIEQKILDNKLRVAVEYTAETIFYGIHINAQILSKLNRKIFYKQETQPIEISFSHAIIIHTLLSGTTVKGLNPDTFAFGHLVYNLAEIIKIFNYYNDLTQMINNEMSQWNMGLVPSSDMDKGEISSEKLSYDEKDNINSSNETMSILSEQED